ncbi:hypothetical protein SHKM778_43420 [Streptomyces sp. KM77-8]|uniref:Deacetylase sirtuin-type domain-containing protein n=1 Tax=Streptomyces haneummycinicus TaxID=3074435 RepID=A0AAT9HKA4_9ACTN
MSSTDAVRCWDDVHGARPAPAGPRLTEAVAGPRGTGCGVRGRWRRVVAGPAGGARHRRRRLTRMTGKTGRHAGIPRELIDGSTGRRPRSVPLLHADASHFEMDPEADLPPGTTDLAPVADALGGGGVLVLSGAGISTESGIPDYRGEGGASAGIRR